MIEATLRYGSSYFWRAPMMLWGTATTRSTPWVTQRFSSSRSPVTFAMP